MIQLSYKKNLKKNGLNMNLSKRWNFIIKMILYKLFLMIKKM